MPAGGHGHHAGGAVAPGLNLPPAAGTGRYGESMKPYLLGGLAAVLMGTAIIASAAPASAGCINARLLLFPTAQKCDAPPAPDGSWERCVVYYAPPGEPGAQTDCHRMGPGEDTIAHPFYDPPDHIDD